jgi:hypothetical protein
MENEHNKQRDMHIAFSLSFSPKLKMMAMKMKLIQDCPL